MQNLSREAIEAINMGLEMERAGYMFFRDLASRTKNQLGRKMFENLAEDEKAHIEIFAKILDNISSSGEWRDYTGDMRAVRKVPVFGEEEVKTLRSEENTQDIEALELALKQEHKAIDFFNKALRETDDKDAKDVFDKILEQEEGHLLLIQGEIDYLSQSCHWFDFSECNMEGMY